jgi:hypothetical protein
MILIRSNLINVALVILVFFVLVSQALPGNRKCVSQYETNSVQNAPGNNPSPNPIGISNANPALKQPSPAVSSNNITDAFPETTEWINQMRDENGYSDQHICNDPVLNEAAQKSAEAARKGVSHAGFEIGVAWAASHGANVRSEGAGGSDTALGLAKQMCTPVTDGHCPAIRGPNGGPKVKNLARCYGIGAKDGRFTIIEYGSFCTCAPKSAR